jgi:hypothetical protein
MFVAGPYTIRACYASAFPAGLKLLGVVESGFELDFTHDVEPVVGDNLGTSIQDGIYRGTNCFLQFQLNEYHQTSDANHFGLNALAWPYGQPSGGLPLWGSLGILGNLASNFSLALQLTALPGSPAETAGPVVVRAKRAILAPGFPIRLLFATTLRTIPLRFQLLPYLNQGENFLRFFQFDSQ